jgi:transketolase
MAAEGVVDFSNAKLLDRRWTLKLLWLCNAYQAKKRSEVITLHFLRVANALSTQHVDLFKKAWSSSEQFIDIIEATDMPWLDRDRKPRKQYDEYKELLEAYKQEFGDWNDPEFRKQVEAEVEEARRKRLGITSG